MAARARGFSEAPCMVARGWSKAQIKAYRLADIRRAVRRQHEVIFRPLPLHFPDCVTILGPSGAVLETPGRP
jgi:hypothetical protein